MVEISYTQSIAFDVRLGGYSLRVVSKPGLPNWDQVTPSAHLIAEHVTLPPSSRALLLGCGHGAAAIPLSRQASSCELWLADRSLVAVQMAIQTLLANHILNAKVYQGIDLPPPGPASFEVVIMDLPKGRKLARRWLAMAFDALRAGGYLYLAGPKELGIQPAIQDATALFGSGVILAYKKGHRIVQWSKPANVEAFDQQPGAWWAEPGVAPGTWHTFQAQIPGLPTPPNPLSLHSLPGVFSYDRLDEGTRLLLEHIQSLPNDTVLDLGCGYGAIGLAAALRGAAHVDLADADLLAVAASEQNLQHLGISNARVIASDVLSALADQRYTLILSNPPFHTGHMVDYQVARAFIEQSQAALQKGGRLVIVANRFIRYDRLMGDIFRKVQIVADDGHFHVLAATK